MICTDYQHRHFAHCETGVASGLLRHYGLPISEPMVLGLSSGMNFVHIPWVKVGGFPLTAYRMWPGAISTAIQKRLGARMLRKRYGSPQAGMRDLDAHLAAGKVVGLQTSIYWLPYFPPEMRFHFNAHNLIVYGKEGGDYLISDPVFEHPVRCPAADLQKARFTKGVFAPKGLLYYPTQVPDGVALEQSLRPALRKTAFQMVKLPLPFLGVRGIRTLARNLRKLTAADPRYARLFLGNVVRMQEEIGTGGAGFRFMYASFLQEAAQQLGNAALSEASEAMTATGDLWRQFALDSAGFVRKNANADLVAIAGQLDNIAAHEDAVFRKLLAWR